ncbi:MAG TPA: ATP-binding protein, partial [Opitutus sp.]|nr:ATP-binding protein [Opitutus sp.]
PVHIDRLVANGREWPVGIPAVVPPGDGELELRFTSPGFVAPRKTRFRYRLEGYDATWVEAGGRRLAYYTNLPPGRYRFRVAAANADGVWNEADAVAEIQLQPHFHQTAWFYFCCAALALGLLFGLYVWRVRLLRRKQQALLRSRAQLEQEVRHRTAELAAANESLQREAEHHQRTASELKERTQLLLETSRQAGMAEVATSVLHNVGNVLNSVNVSATVVSDRVAGSKIPYVAKLGGLLQENAATLATFVTEDPKGRRIPGYLATLGEDLLEEQRTVVAELGTLRKNIDHIKSIVAMQQSFAKVSGVTETVPLAGLVDEAIRMNASSFSRHEVAIARDDQGSPTLTIERHKVMQILVNLLRNASQACDETRRSDKKIVVRTTQHDASVKIMVVDNGVGIAPQNLRQIFSHGFTTKKGGHGFGLHSAALTARELGGSLSAHSDGPGCGATFTLELPLTPPSVSS